MSLTPINDFVSEYILKDMSRFHMPGHKGGLLLKKAEGETGDIFKRDITEIDGADSLYEASGIIAQSENIASHLFDSAATFFGVEGSSQMIKAMLALVTMFSEGTQPKVILAARNVHRSFIAACALLDLDVEWLYSEEEDYSLCSAPVDADTVRKKLESMQVLPSAVYLTSPDYLGGMQDISAVAKVAHEAGIPLLVDNAHGAYLHFLNEPVHPIDLGADMCCDSAHKTLPCLTGCAYLHMSKKASKWLPLWKKNARRALSLFGSTSPSYILLQSLDSANYQLANEWPAKVRKCCEMTAEVKRKLKEMGWYIKEGSKFLTSEPMKIVIDTARVGITGMELAGILRECGIECEYADPDYVVLMPSPDNRPEDYTKLLLAMEQLGRCDNADLLMTGRTHLPEFSRPKKIMSIKEAIFSESEEIDAQLGEGRILSDTAIACPPAVPLIVCGEEIPEGAAKLFAHYNIEKINVIK